MKRRTLRDEPEEKQIKLFFFREAYISFAWVLLKMHKEVKEPYVSLVAVEASCPLNVNGSFTIHCQNLLRKTVYIWDAKKKIL